MAFAHLACISIMMAFVVTPINAFAINDDASIIEYEPGGEFATHYREDEIEFDSNVKRTHTEEHILGVWISLDRRLRIVINPDGTVIQNGVSPGRMVFPCCANFAFRRPNSQIYDKFEKCSYRIYFSSRYDKTYWIKISGEKVPYSRCPEGLLRRDRLPPRKQWIYR